MASIVLAHRIALDPNEKQEEYFRQACGVARHAYNWGLAQWEAEYKDGGRPNAYSLKKAYNAIRSQEFPWSRDVARCASGQAFINLQAAYRDLFEDLRRYNEGKIRHCDIRRPKFKKKGRRNSFALWNGQFNVEGNQIRIAHLGWLRMAETLRHNGKILGATVSNSAGRWFVAVQVEMQKTATAHPKPGSIVGIDLGISHLMTLSRPLPDGTVKIPNPKPRRAYAKRQAKLHRRISRQELQRRRTEAKRSNRQARRQLALSKLHYRIANIRKDAIHKATTAIAKHFETIVVEDLNVSGMVKNHNLAGAIHDAAFYEQKRQIQYKAVLNCGKVIEADRFFPSSKTCSCCGHVVDKLPLSIREWDCPECGAHHDRDENAAKNLELVGQAMPEPSLDNPSITRGETEALASASAEVKLPSMNRELKMRADARKLESRQAPQDLLLTSTRRTTMAKAKTTTKPKVPVTAAEKAAAGRKVAASKAAKAKTVKTTAKKPAAKNAVAKKTTAKKSKKA